MNTKKIAALSLAATLGTTAMGTSFASSTAAGEACIESATQDVAYILRAIRAAYADGYSDNELDAVTTSYNGFTIGGGLSTAIDGFVYSKFGKQSGGGEQYIVTGYFGSGCGPITGTKLFCNLKKGGSNFAGTTTVTSALGFSMDCKICTGVRLSAAGQEEAYSSSGYDEDIMTTAANALSASMDRSSTSGMSLSSTTETWAADDGSGGGTCYETVT